MSASPKSKRTPDERRMLEDYVLTKEAGPNAGLYPIASSKMEYVPATGEFTPGAGAYLQGATDGQCTIPIGFTFKIDDLEYTKIHINVRGWALLLQESRSLSNYNDIFTGGFNQTSRILSTFAHDDVFLAPWFGTDMKNVWRDLDPVAGVTDAYLTLLSTDRSSVANGLSPYPRGVDSEHGGVKYYKGKSESGIRILVVRWKSFTKNISSELGKIAHFDLVIYENGKIEFRYAPKIFDRIFEDANGERAVTGIFASGPSFYSDRYRDACPLLGITDSRGVYKNGGAVYDGLYTDTGGSKYCRSLHFLKIVKYLVGSARLTAQSNWPAREKEGAILKFSPPRIRHRQNRSIVQLRDAISFAGNESSMFDDQKTLSFTTQAVEYPTMLPVSQKTTTNSPDGNVASLYADGSIQVVRSGTYPGLLDSVVNDMSIEYMMRRGR